VLKRQMVNLKLGVKKLSSNKKPVLIWGEGERAVVFHKLAPTEELNRQASRFFSGFKSLEFDPIDKRIKLDYFHK